MNFERQFNNQEKLLYPHLLSVLDTLGLELYDFDFERGSARFRVFIINPSTKTASLKECVSVDRALSSVFEDEDFPENVVLEVSSPGIYRSIRTMDHFSMARGELIKLKLIEKVESYKGKELIGKLVDLDDNQITLEVLKDNKIINICFSNIKSANAEYVF